MENPTSSRTSESLFHEVDSLRDGESNLVPYFRVISSRGGFSAGWRIQHRPGLESRYLTRWTLCGKEDPTSACTSPSPLHEMDLLRNRRSNLVPYSRSRMPINGTSTRTTLRARSHNIISRVLEQRAYSDSAELINILLQQVLHHHPTTKKTTETRPRLIQAC